MPDIETKRIDELIAAQDIGDSDLFVIEQGGAAKKALGSVVKEAIGGSSLPPGGTPGQVLTKTANGTEWDDVSGLPDGGTSGQVLTKSANGAEWTDAGTPTQAQTNAALADYLDEHPEAVTNIPDRIKQALLACFRKVAWVDANGQTYYQNLYNALMNKEVLSIAAVFTQGSAVILDTNDLDVLRRYLVVTASYDDGTTGEVTAYELSGTLTGGTSVITATYDEKTTTFNVTVTSTYLYTLENQAVTTTEESKFATGIDLISADKDFSICFDASIGTKNGSYKLFYAWENTSPWRGPTCGAGGSNAFNVKYLANSRTINNTASSVTSVKVVMVHAAGSNKAVFYSRINGASSTTTTTISDNFVALTPILPDGLTFGYHTSSNNWSGTINRAYVRSVALTAEQAESFLAGE